MRLSWPQILISVQPDWLWSTGRGGVNYNCSIYMRPQIKKRANSDYDLF